VGREPYALSTAGIHVRFVIANPSSYLYFNDDRPQADRSFAPFDGQRCPQFDHWRYGPQHAPAYVGDTSASAWNERETTYAHADAIYLLGRPTPIRLRWISILKAYFSYVQNRHPADLQQRLWFVPDVGHVGRTMLESTCAIAAIFDAGSCLTQADIGTE